MTVSLGVGFMMWLGTFMLSKQPSGFDQVAIVSTGLQWRGPLLLLALSLGTVAVPAFSRFESQRDVSRSANLRAKLVLVNLTVALFAVLVLTLASGRILALYGQEFASGRLSFSLIILSCVPTVINNVYMHQLVGAGRMWRVLWLHCPYFAVWLTGILVLVPKYQAAGFALSLVIGATVLLISTLLVERWGPLEARHAQ